MRTTKKIFFVTSTGTDLGKTYISKNLIRIFKKKKISINPYKPIVSGVNKKNLFQSDGALLLKELNLNISVKDIKQISPWIFKQPLAPTLAAKKEKKKIKYSTIIKWFKNELKLLKNDFALIEGVGGLMVPIGEKKTFIDFICKFNIPIILVIGNYLGTISHTLSLIKTIELANLHIINIVLNEGNEKKIKINDTEFLLRENLEKKYKIRKIYNSRNNEKAFEEIFQDTFKYFI
ncbi:MAG: dethiobiotin synthase [Rickettsiales bacterium]|nr:dethiobiotin synthase [Rickettsiales bacterium]